MTPLQHRCLVMVRNHIGEKGYSPTYEEIAQAVGTCKSKAHDAATALIQQGALARTAARWRNLRLPGAYLAGVSTEDLRAELERRGV